MHQPLSLLGEDYDVKELASIELAEENTFPGACSAVRQGAPVACTPILRFSVQVLPRPYIFHSVGQLEPNYVV